MTGLNFQKPNLKLRNYILIKNYKDLITQIKNKNITFGIDFH